MRITRIAHDVFFNVTDDRGISLIEILVGIVVFSLGLLGVAQITTSVIGSNTFARNVTTSTTLVQDKLEDLYRLGYSNANSAVGTEDYGSMSNFESFKRVTTVTDDSPAVGMKTVSISVFWANDVGVTSMSTIFVE